MCWLISSSSPYVTAAESLESSLAMEKKVINQKEYLRKYMSSDDGEKKRKKKKHKRGAKTVKIIDDDIGLKSINPTEGDVFNILLDGEDAPQIAGIIDERGPVDFTDKRRWKILTTDDNGGNNSNDGNNGNDDDDDSDLDITRATDEKERDRPSAHRDKRKRREREETRVDKRRGPEKSNKRPSEAEVSGFGEGPIMRDRTGRRRNLEAEAAEERERKLKQREMDEKYAKWGKGLKQVEDREEKLKDDLYEMSKPLARYADDADLDKRLKEQEREGDPMLEYIKQKQIKEGKRKPDPPRYRGSYAPNRFGIKPGHRWDGVDRSNGYEKKWFESQNAKTARQEEAYKWSTADM